jgi:hypothetical protein
MAEDTSAPFVDPVDTWFDVVGRDVGAADMATASSAAVSCSIEGDRSNTAGHCYKQSNRLHGIHGDSQHQQQQHKTATMLEPSPFMLLSMDAESGPYKRKGNPILVDDSVGVFSQDTTQQQQACRKRRRDLKEEEQRLVRNENEKQRSHLISTQFHDLQTLLSEAGILIARGTKERVLEATMEYIQMLQQEHTKKEQ